VRRRTPKLAREIPRLCRGGSKSLTFPAVAPQAPIDETSSMSRQAHAQGSIDGRPWESLKHGDESAKCYAAFVPRYRGRNCTLSSDAASGIHEPPSGGPHIGGASATPIAALSGSQHKAPGFAGGYLLQASNVDLQRWPPAGTLAWIYTERESPNAESAKGFIRLNNLTQTVIQNGALIAL
jgi:hypothetical protein